MPLELNPSSPLLRHHRKIRQNPRESSAVPGERAAEFQYGQRCSLDLEVRRFFEPDNKREANAVRRKGTSIPWRVGLLVVKPDCVFVFQRIDEDRQAQPEEKQGIEEWHRKQDWSRAGGTYSEKVPRGGKPRYLFVIPI
ncbi:hypothetical protein NMY22_g16890 [Coprinellus aureogranulatus]|nr:hypothetical protein NMY22_g16890 [Coprinellus aureogranulatus]